MSKQKKFPEYLKPFKITIDELVLIDILKKMNIDSETALYLIRKSVGID